MRWVFLAVALAACQSNDLNSLASRLTVPEGARTITVQVGARVETAACYPGGDPTTLARSLQEKLRPEGGDVRLIPNEAIPGRFVVVGERDGFGVAGFVDAPRRGECADGEVLVSVGAHAIGPAAAAGTTAGPVGPRRHDRMRVPIVPKVD